MNNYFYMMNFFQNYFYQFKDGIDFGYYNINYIPTVKIFGYSLNIYLYLFFVLGLFIILIFKEISVLRHWRKINFRQIFIYFTIFFWLLTLARWFSIEFRWLANDVPDFKGKSLISRRAQVTGKILSHSGFPKSWEDYYDFLEFARNEIPKGATCYIIPFEKTMFIWARYWLYPDLKISKKGARYILTFNIDLSKKIHGFELFKQFSPNKFILKAVDKGNPVNSRNN